MSVPRIYTAINAVAAEFARSGVPKSHTNVEGQYQYRGIDDIYNRLSPLLAAHRVCVLPRVLERVANDRAGVDGTLLVSVTIRVAFDLVSAEDASVHVVEAFGEALDSSDKATSKAMTAAYKYAVIQAFCIPVCGTEDADASSPKLSNGHSPEPVQGWRQWAADIQDMIRLCETDEALARVQQSNRALLHSLSKEKPELYASVGEAMALRRQALKRPVAKARGKRARPQKAAPRPRRAKQQASAEGTHA